MPNLRDYTMQARQLNTRIWAQREPRTAIEPEWLTRAGDYFSERAHKTQAMLMSQRRSRLVLEIDLSSYSRECFSFNKYVRDYVVTKDPAKAHDVLHEKLLKIQRKSGHWSRDAGLISDLKEALTFVRYFRRYGNVIWNKDASE